VESSKLIQSTMGVNRSPHLDMNVETLERFCKDTIWLFGCFIVVSSFVRSNRRKETCHDYIWKSQVR